MNVLITGANGTVGSALQSHLDSDFDLTLLDINGDDNITIGDVRDYKSIRSSFDEQDAVIHLAVHPLTDDNWVSVLETNIIGTYNVLKATRDASVPTFVYASSNHAVGLYERENVPEIYYNEIDFTLDEETPHRPDSFYGTSKAFGEDLTCYFTNRFQYPTRAQSIRICTVRESEYDHPYGVAEQGVAEGRWRRDSAVYALQIARQRAMWHSRSDCAQLFQRCLKSNTDGYDIFYGVSDNERRWVDIEHAKKVIGYEPEESADEWDVYPTENPNTER